MNRKTLPEWVVCSAIWFKEFKVPNPEHISAYGFKPYNTETGIVITGWRHHNCIATFAALTGQKISNVGEYVEGFLTSKNRFVDRAEAAKIATQRGQVIDSSKFQNNKLFSEDLY